MFYVVTFGRIHTSNYFSFWNKNSNLFMKRFTVFYKQFAAITGF